MLVTFTANKTFSPMSALSAFVNSTGNAQAKEKLDYVVFELKEIQRADGCL